MYSEVGSNQSQSQSQSQSQADTHTQSLINRSILILNREVDTDPHPDRDRDRDFNQTHAETDTPSHAQGHSQGQRVHLLSRFLGGVTVILKGKVDIIAAAGGIEWPAGSGLGTESGLVSDIDGSGAVEAGQCVSNESDSVHVHDTNTTTTNPNTNTNTNTTKSTAISTTATVYTHTRGTLQYMNEVVVASGAFEEQSMRRCGGQGDILAGCIGVATHWGSSNTNIQELYREFDRSSGSSGSYGRKDPGNNPTITNRPINSPISTLSPIQMGNIMGAVLASTVVKTASLRAFQKHHRGVSSVHILDEVSNSFHELTNS